MVKESRLRVTDTEAGYLILIYMIVGLFDKMLIK